MSSKDLLKHQIAHQNNINGCLGLFRSAYGIAYRPRREFNHWLTSNSQVHQPFSQFLVLIRIDEWQQHFVFIDIRSQKCRKIFASNSYYVFFVILVLNCLTFILFIYLYIWWFILLVLHNFLFSCMSFIISHMHLSWKYDWYLYLLHKFLKTLTEPNPLTCFGTWYAEIFKKNMHMFNWIPKIFLWFKVQLSFLSENRITNSYIAFVVHYYIICMMQSITTQFFVIDICGN